MTIDFNHFKTLLFTTFWENNDSLGNKKSYGSKAINQETYSSADFTAVEMCRLKAELRLVASLSLQFQTAAK